MNLHSFSDTIQQKLANSGVSLEAVEFFEYGKNNEEYWTGEHLLKQVVKKAMPIKKALYPGYQLLFLFDNATSHLVFASDALQVDEINKGTGGQQKFLRNRWYTDSKGDIIQQKMSFFHPSSILNQPPLQVQKRIQRVLEEQSLWSKNDLKLSCEKSKCSNCQAVSSCKLCVKGKQCELCIKPKVHRDKCDKSRICDKCVRCKDRCQCMQKKYCTSCKENGNKKSCLDCEKCHLGVYHLVRLL